MHDSRADRDATLLCIIPCYLVVSNTVSGSCSFCAWLQFHCSKQRTNILVQWLNDGFVIIQRRHKMRITRIFTHEQSRYTSWLPTVIVYSAYKCEVVVVFHLGIYFFLLNFSFKHCFALYLTVHC